MSSPEVHHHEEPEEVESTVLPVPLTDGMVAEQIATAKRYPRSVSRFRKEAQDLACLDQETAGECLFAVRRSGKLIEGPSVRMAEILLHAWGNARADAEVVEEGATHVTAQGTFFDLERNMAVRKKVKRRITDKHGRRYNDDMIGVTGNAAISIALRNAVFAGIPKAVWKPVYQQARKASLGEAGTLTQARQKMLDYFGKMGVKDGQVYALLGIDGVEDIKEDELVTLRGLANAIKDGEASVEETFNPRETDVQSTPDLNARIRQQQEEDAAIRAEDQKLAQT